MDVPFEDMPIDVLIFLSSCSSTHQYNNNLSINDSKTHAINLVLYFLSAGAWTWKELKVMSYVYVSINKSFDAFDKLNTLYEYDCTGTSSITIIVLYNNKGNDSSIYSSSSNTTHHFSYITVLLDYIRTRTFCSFRILRRSHILQPCI